MLHEVEQDLSLRMMDVTNLSGLIDLRGRHVATSVLSALHVGGDVPSNPISHTLVVDIGVFGNQCLVVLEVIIELVRILFTQTDGSNLDE
tara:strand:+ start:277 stop:546 length:270 start_codon:yes stop_codon:yes gene_type:complete